MAQEKLITVSLPCYNNTDQIKFLLWNRGIRCFVDFDVVGTDNINNNEIEQL